MTESTPAIALLAIGLFCIGGVISLYKQDMKKGSAFCALFAVMCIVGAVMWW